MSNNNKNRIIKLLPGSKGRVITPDQVRAESCMNTINEIMRKYDCRAIPQVTIDGEGHVSGGFIIVPNVRKVENP